VPFNVDTEHKEMLTMLAVISVILYVD